MALTFIAFWQHIMQGYFLDKLFASKYNLPQPSIIKATSRISDHLKQIGNLLNLPIGCKRSNVQIKMYENGDFFIIKMVNITINLFS